MDMPASIEAERALLGALLIDSAAMPTIAAIVQPDDFYIEAHRAIYTAALAVYEGGDPIDLITLTEHLRNTNHLEDIGGVSAVSSLANQVPSSVNITAYAKILAQVADRRRLIALWQRHAMLGYDGEVAPLDAITQIQEGITGVSERIIGRTTEHGKAIFSAAELLTMEIPDPHLIVAGIIPEGLTILGGRPKMGKSWLALNLGWSVAEGDAALGYTSVEQGDVLYLALEDTPARLRGRIEQNAQGRAAPTALHFSVSCPRLDAGGLVVIENWIRAHPRARMVIVDTYAKFAPDTGDNTGNLYQQDYAAMSALKRLGDKHHIGMVAVHHLRKSGSATDDPLEELSGTNAISGAADCILVLKRPRNQDDGTLAIVARDIEENELAIHFDRATGLWRVMGQSAEITMSGNERKIAQAIIEAGCPLSPVELVELTELKRNTIKSLVWRMAKKGGLVADQHGKYSIAEG